MRISGAGWAWAMLLAMDQIFSFAAWIKPPILPVVSSTKTTSILGRGLGFAVAVCWVGGGLVTAAIVCKSGYSHTVARVKTNKAMDRSLVFMAVLRNQCRDDRRRNAASAARWACWKASSAGLSADNPGWRVQAGMAVNRA